MNNKIILKWLSWNDSVFRDENGELHAKASISKDSWYRVASENPDLDNRYNDFEKYHQIIPEIKFLSPVIIKRKDMFETDSVSDEIADRMSFEEPVKVSLFSDGELKLSDGHHRLAAALRLGMNKIPVIVRAINVGGDIINRFIKMSEELSLDVLVSGKSNWYRAAQSHGTLRQATLTGLKNSFKQTVDKINQSVQKRKDEKGIFVSPEQIYRQKVSAYKNLLKNEFNILIDNFSPLDSGGPDSDINLFIENYSRIPHYSSPTRFNNPFVNGLELGEERHLDFKDMENDLEDFFKTRLKNVPDPLLQWVVDQSKTMIDSSKSIKENESELYRISRIVQLYINYPKTFQGLEINSISDIEHASDSSRPKFEKIPKKHKWAENDDLRERAKEIWIEQGNEDNEDDEDEDEEYNDYRKDYRARKVDEIYKELIEEYYTDSAPVPVLFKDIEPGVIEKTDEYAGYSVDYSGKYLLYHADSVSDCIILGKDTSWCFAEEETAYTYVRDGDIWILYKDEKPFRAIDLMSSDYKDVHDASIREEEIQIIFPEFFSIIRESGKKKAKKLGGPDSSLLNGLVVPGDDDYEETVREVIKSVPSKLLLLFESDKIVKSSPVYEEALDKIISNNNSDTVRLLERGFIKDEQRKIGTLNSLIEGSNDYYLLFGLLSSGLITEENYPREYNKLMEKILNNSDKWQNRESIFSDIAKIIPRLKKGDNLLDIAMKYLEIRGSDRTDKYNIANTIIQVGLIDRNDPRFLMLVGVATEDDFENAKSLIENGYITEEEYKKANPEGPEDSLSFIQKIEFEKDYDRMFNLIASGELSDYSQQSYGLMSRLVHFISEGRRRDLLADLVAFGYVSLNDNTWGLKNICQKIIEKFGESKDYAGILDNDLANRLLDFWKGSNSEYVGFSNPKVVEMIKETIKGKGGYATEMILSGLVKPGTQEYINAWDTVINHPNDGGNWEEWLIRGGFESPEELGGATWQSIKDEKQREYEEGKNKRYDWYNISSSKKNFHKSALSEPESVLMFKKIISTWKQDKY